MKSVATCNKRHFTTLLSLLLSGLIYSTASFAGTIDIALDFNKKPAKFGIVYLYDEKAPPISGVINQKDKKFLSGVVAVSPNSTLIFKNDDTVDHNIFANETSDNFTLKLDIGLMPVNSEQELEVDWSSDTLVRIGCKIHPKMKSYIANIKAEEFNIFKFDRKEPNYTTTLNSKSDNAEIKILLDRYDPISLTVKPGESQTIDLIRKGKTKGTATISHQE